LPNLLAVITCRSRRSQANAQRNTWVQSSRDDVRFFVGQGNDEPNEIALPVDDSYQGLPVKVQSAVRWALDHDYDSFLKLDDDVYLVPERLPRYDEDYVGNFRSRNGSYAHDYASGFCYYLSHRAMEIVANASLTEDTMEDRWVGQTLMNVCVRCRDEKRFSCPYPTGVEAPQKLWGSNLGKEAIALAQYPADKFFELHYWYRRVFRP
jgi:hypothetical protein